MKIWHQSLTVLQDVPAYRDTLRSHLDAVAGLGTTVEMHGMLPGTFGPGYPTDFISHAWAQRAHLPQFVEAGLAAEAEYDAFLVGTMPDLGLPELRSLLEIPVAGYGQAAFHVASLVGRHAALVGFSRSLSEQISANVEAYGIGPVLVSRHHIQADFGSLMESYADPGPMIDAFRSAAQVAIDGGADVIVPGEGPLALLLASNGVSRLGDVPVVDPIASGVAVCEMLVHLKSASGLAGSRAGFYFGKPSDDVIAHIRAFYDRRRPST